MKSSSAILLIEDDVVDVMTVQRAMRELKVTNPLRVVSNGEEAFVSLRDPMQPLPGLILLDLNMPRMNGIEFLSLIKQDTQLRRLPVLVLTTSKEANDRLRSFDLGVAGYIIKPVEYDRFVDVMRAIEQYWRHNEMAP